MFYKRQKKIENIEKNILIFGNGYSSSFISKQAKLLGYHVFIVSRNPDRNPIQEIDYINFRNQELVNSFIQKSIIISTVPPDKDGLDPVLSEYGGTLKKQKNICCYISSTSVYGPGLVFEDSLCNPDSRRGKIRLKIEDHWLQTSQNIQIFRSGGIYGLDRHPMIKFLNGNHEVSVKKDHYPNRINVEDLAKIILVSIQKHAPKRIINVTDQKNITTIDAINYVASELGLTKPLPVDYQKASISDMAREFFSSSKTVRSKIVTEVLNYSYIHPDFKKALLQLTISFLETQKSNPKY